MALPYPSSVILSEISYIYNFSRVLWKFSCVITVSSCILALLAISNIYSLVGKLVLTSISYPFPNLFLMCCTLPIHLIIPSAYIAILVDKNSASSIECVVKIIELYFLLVAILDITFHINLLACGSIPVLGSSKNTMGGFPSMAIATESFLLFPPE